MSNCSDTQKSTAQLTDVGFDWGEMAVERCFEDRGVRCVRIRSIRTGAYMDVELSAKGKSLKVGEVQQDDRLKGRAPYGPKRIFDVVFTPYGGKEA